MHPSKRSGNVTDDEILEDRLRWRRGDIRLSAERTTPDECEIPSAQQIELDDVVVNGSRDDKHMLPCSNRWT